METSRPVLVKRMPAVMNLKESRAFLRELQSILRSDRPQIVFDLSQVKRLDAAGVEMLLHCMAEAMRRDGDVKLAAVSPQAMVVLEMTRTERLFEVYSTSTDAMRSFSAFLPNTVRRKDLQPQPQPLAA